MIEAVERMEVPIDERDAQLALGTVERGRQQVVAEIGVPQWYWLFLAAGWAGIGAVAQFGPAWAASAATLIFGAVHASIAPRVISGRRGSAQLSVRSELVSGRMPAVILGFVAAMAALTVGFALLLNADGARHPGLVAGVIVGMLVYAGGPSLVAGFRRRAERW